MDISYLGNGSVRLVGRSITVMVDPKKQKSNTDVVLLTGSDELAQSIQVQGMVIANPGEYEVRGSMITGVPARLHIDESGTRATCFRISIDGVAVVILGNISSNLSAEQRELLGEPDVLIIPTGGKGLTLDASAAAELSNSMEPKYIIPVHYDDGVSQYPMPQDKVDVFLAEVGVSPEPVAKLKVMAKELPEEATVVVLQTT